MKKALKNKNVRLVIVCFFVILIPRKAGGGSLGKHNSGTRR